MVNDVIDVFLAKKKTLGLSAPAGTSWIGLFELITHGLPEHEWPYLPLILNGAAFSSDSSKQRRLKEHLMFADEHGRLDEALTYLASLNSNCWYECHNLANWSTEPSWWEDLGDDSEDE